MSTVSNLPAKQETSKAVAFGSFLPSTLSEWMDVSNMIAKSNMCPKDLIGKPESVFLALQMGAEIGLKPMQAIQNIAVINGRPCVWGDAALAVIKGHPDFLDLIEIVTDNKAICTIKRKGCADVVREFTLEDANRAGLSKKPGPWTQYPKRMLQMRARSFAMRDSFPDALRGINIAEEVSDYEMTEKNITPPQFIEQPQSEKDIDHDYFNLKQALESVDNFDDLKALTPELQLYNKNFVNKETLRSLYKEKMMALRNVEVAIKENVIGEEEGVIQDESIPAEQ